MKYQLNESIVLDGAAARGDADQEPEAVARVWKPPFRKHARATGVLAMRRCDVHCRETHVRLTSDAHGAMRRTRGCCSMARARQSRWRAELGGGGGARARTRQPACDGRGVGRRSILRRERQTAERVGGALRNVDRLRRPHRQPGARIYRPVRAAGRVGAEAEWCAEHVCAHRLQVRTPLGDTRQARAAGGGARGFRGACASLP